MPRQSVARVAAKITSPPATPPLPLKPASRRASLLPQEHVEAACAAQTSAEAGCAAWMLIRPVVLLSNILYTPKQEPGCPTYLLLTRPHATIQLLS